MFIRIEEVALSGVFCLVFRVMGINVWGLRGKEGNGMCSLKFGF